MRKTPHSMRYLGLLGAVLLAGTVRASDEPADVSRADNEVARLTALAEAQQQRVEALRRQVGAVQQDADAARVEKMKEQIREVLSEQEFRESLLPAMVQAGYDGGFFIRSTDERFLLKIGGVMQMRWTHYATRSDNRWQQPRLQRNDRTGFDIQRLRLDFKGHAYTQDLTYRFLLEMGRGSDYALAPEYAYFNYRFCDAFQIMGGLFKLNATLAQVMSTSSMQFVDRPMPDGVFELGNGVGVRFWGLLLERRLEYSLDVANSLNGPGNRVITPDVNTPTGTELDSNPALVLRAVWHALGDKPGKDLKDQGDLEFHESPALDLGFHYAFNEDEGDTATTRIPYKLPRPRGPGAFGRTTTNGMQVNQFGLDTAFKWQGFSAIAEYYFRTLDVRRAGRRPFTNYWRLTGDDSTPLHHGAYVQMGYFLPIPGFERKLEAVARVGGVGGIGPGNEGSWEYAGGLNCYLQGHKVKLQTDVTRIYELPLTSSSRSYANLNDDALIWRVQLQVTF